MKKFKEQFAKFFLQLSACLFVLAIAPKAHSDSIISPICTLPTYNAFGAAFDKYSPYIFYLTGSVRDDSGVLQSGMHVYDNLCNHTKQCIGGIWSGNEDLVSGPNPGQIFISGVGIPVNIGSQNYTATIVDASVDPNPTNMCSWPPWAEVIPSYDIDLMSNGDLFVAAQSHLVCMVHTWNNRPPCFADSNSNYQGFGLGIDHNTNYVYVASDSTNST